MTPTIVGSPSTGAARVCPRPAATLAPRTAPWWTGRVFHEVFVRSFADSNGDGVGDLRGLTDRLDYHNDGDATTTDDLGVLGCG